MDVNTTNSFVDNSLLPPFGKGAIVLTPQKFVGRVRWIHKDDQVGVEYLEMSGAYNVYQSSELTLLLPSAENPKFDEVCLKKVEHERMVYEETKAMAEEFKKRKPKVQKSATELALEKALKNISPEKLAEILEDI